MVTGPAGTRCPECASLRSSHLYRVAPHRLILATVLGVLAGTIGAYVLDSISFFVFFIGPAYGAIVAEIVLRAIGRKRGRIVEGIGVGSIVLGALIVIGVRIAHGLMIASRMNAALSIGAELGVVLMGSIWPLIGIALAISTCYSKLKYF